MLTNSIRIVDFKIEILNDSSSFTWGAHCAKGKTRGYWNSSEKQLYINELELNATYFGMLCLAKDLRNCEILLYIDNTAAISYINRMGLIQFSHLTRIARDICN